MDSKPPQLTPDIPAAPSHAPAAVSDSEPESPPHRPTALLTCTFLGTFTFTTLYHAYQHQPILREMHSYLMLMSAFVLVQRYQPQLWHHWRACARAYVRGVVTALVLWAFLLVVSIGVAKRMTEEEMRDRLQMSGELIGWFSVLISWGFWATDADYEQLGRELDALRGEAPLK